MEQGHARGKRFGPDTSRRLPCLVDVGLDMHSLPENFQHMLFSCETHQEPRGGRQIEPPPVPAKHLETARTPHHPRRRGLRHGTRPHHRSDVGTDGGFSRALGARPETVHSDVWHQGIWLISGITRDWYIDLTKVDPITVRSYNQLGVISGYVGCSLQVSST